MDVLKELIKQGNLQNFVDNINLISHIDERDVLGNTLLILSAHSGHYTITEFLLKNGADVNAVTYKGNTSIMAAIVGLRMTVCEGNKSCINNYTILISTLLSFHPEIVDHKNENGETALLKACYYGFTSIVNLLLEHKVDINTCNNVGDTPLILCSYYGYTGYTEGKYTMKRKNYEDIINSLLLMGADINKVNKYGQTPLMKAVEYGYIKIVNLLLSHKPDLTIVNNCGETVMSIATENEYMSSILQTPSNEDISPFIQQDESPFMQQNISPFAQQNISPFVQQNISPFMQQNISPFMQQNVLPNIFTPISTISTFSREKRTKSLWDFCKEGNVEGLERMVNNANLDIKDELGNTGLIYAVKNNHINVISLLLNNGANVNEKDKLGNTALMIALKEKKTGIALFLLRYSCNLEDKNLQGETIVDLALDMEDILNVILTT
jgi:ankyrin repeat protein